MFMTFDKRLYIYASLILLPNLFVAATLPSSLQSLIPLCAQPCLDTIVQQEYSGICSEPTTLDCLCTHYGNSGYAISEGAISCVQSSNCSVSSQTNSSSIAFICATISGAVPATHTPTSTPTSSQQSSPATVTSSAVATDIPTTVAPSTTSAMAQASVSAGPDGVSMSGKVSLSMAQIAGITIAAAALVILAVGVLSCILFVRKRNKRLEIEEQKSWAQSATPKTPNMQDIYFPPPPSSAGRRSGASSRFSILPRKSKEADEENPGMQVPAASLQQRTWPRYYPIMPEENIGIATTTSYPYPVDPVQTKPYIPAPAPSPVPSPLPIQVPSSPPLSNNIALSSRPSSISSVPTYQPYSEYHSGISFPQPPSVAYTGNTRAASQSSRRSSHAPTKTRQSTFSMMTDIDEGAQVSSRELSFMGISESYSRESVTSPDLAASASVKKARRPTLSINIPAQKQSKPSLPPPPASRPPSLAPGVLPGPPPPTRAPNTNSAPARQTSTSKAPATFSIAPPRQPLPKLPTTSKPQVRPPLLREEHVHQIPNSPSDILAAASTYATARKTSDEPSRESQSRESASSAALPSSHALPDRSTFLLSDSERNTSSRSNSSVRRPSRGPSRNNSRRGSDASCTSFEDDGEDSEDETPPREESRRLSPVTESSPVSTLRYPKIPRSANQVVPRSPGTPKRRTHDSPQPSPRLRPDVDTAAAAALTQTIGNRLWKTELSPQGKKPLATPEWQAHRRSESWQTWAQNTPDASSAGTLQTPQKPFAGNDAPRLTPTRTGDDLFLEMKV